MDLFRFDPPDLSDAAARQIAAELYGVTGAALRLRGERAHNTLFTTDRGDRFVLRVASASEPAEAIECPALALEHLAHTAPELPVARVVPALDGALVPAYEIGDREHRVRLETFLPGLTFGDQQHLTLPALNGIGRMLGRVAAALEGFEHPATEGFLAWNIANGLALYKGLIDALADDARQLVDRALPRVESAMSAMAGLPRQVIHNDGHAGNLLRAGPDSEQVTGLIDFGDLVRTATVVDLGVSGASFVPHQIDPVAALAALVDGYAEHRPLSAPELAAIPDLVTTRLVLSALLIQYQLDHAPHLVEAVTPEREMTNRNLQRWLDVTGVS
jgi:Ser/Thr protein kinase RdoA (MazF antagonist)